MPRRMPDDVCGACQGAGYLIIREVDPKTGKTTGETRVTCRGCQGTGKR